MRIAKAAGAAGVLAAYLPAKSKPNRVGIWLDVADYDWKEHWLDVSRAVKGARLDTAIAGPPSGTPSFGKKR